MTEYQAVKCSNCKRAFSSTAKIPHCPYCSNKKNNIMFAKSEKPREIIETVAQYNYNNR